MRPDWRTKLIKSESNPWPLAPFDLVQKGLVNDTNYQAENQSWGKTWSILMAAELPTLRDGHIEVFGAGLARDLGWIPDAVLSFNCTVAIRDNEEVARENALRFLEQQNLPADRVQVTDTTIPAGWDDGTIRDEDTKAYFMSQFIEHQREETDHILRHLGAFLKLPNRVVYLIVPKKEDNSPDQVPWESAVPLEEDELTVPLAAGLEGIVVITTLHKHSYFSHRVYSLLRIQAA